MGKIGGSGTSISIMLSGGRAGGRPGGRQAGGRLGGRFPAGYPVGEVTKVAIDPGKPFAEVRAKPLAELDRSRNVLLVFSDRPAAE